MTKTRILVVIPEEERQKEIQKIINSGFPDKNIRLTFFDQLGIKEFSELKKEPHLIITSDCALITEIKKAYPKLPIIKLTDYLEGLDGKADEELLIINGISPFLLEEAVKSSTQMRFASSLRI